MYTTRNLNDDLHQICTKYYVKFRLLQDFAYKRIDHKYFVENLMLIKKDSEVKEILREIQKIFEKISLNGGKLDPDPIELARQLRKEGKLREAFETIIPYLQANKEDENAILTFGWIMYEKLKMSENNIKKYVNNLAILNDYAKLPFDSIYSDIFASNYMKTLACSILWSIRRVVMKSDLNANIVFPQFMRLCCNEAKFIEKRRTNINNEAAVTRVLVKEFIGKLNHPNYLVFLDAIGFDWFDKWDYEKTSFANDKGEIIEVKPLAEYVLNYHSKKLLSMDISVDAEQRIHAFIEVLNSHIETHPSFEWLPYYRSKLLMKVNRKEEALEAVISFARTKRNEFWIWDLISELVNHEEKFNCLCAALLCRTKPEMIVGIQEKIIPYLIEKKMFSNAKYELDELISTRVNKWGKISQQLKEWKNEKWYIESKAAENRDALKEYQRKAETILYRTLPFIDIFITYTNKEKGVIHFVYFEKSDRITEGFAYIDSIDLDHECMVDTALKVKMIADQKKSNFFRIYETAHGDETFLSKFIQKGSGTVRKIDTNPFAFADDVYISPDLVKVHGIKERDKIIYIKKKKFNKKRNTWGWAVDKIISVERE